MAIKDFPNVNPDANATFGLESNTSEFRSVLSNDVQHMSLPGDRWVGSVSFTNRTRNEANKIKAFKASLGGQSGRFYFTPVDAYQAGTMGGSGVVNGAVASGSSSLPTNGWTAGQDTLFEAGDYLEVNGELKMVVDDVDASSVGSTYIEYTGTNYMPNPFDPEGWSGSSDLDGSITNIELENPSGSSLVGLIESITGDRFSFADSYNNSVSIGDKIWMSLIFKPITDQSLGVRFRFFDGATEIGDGYARPSNQSTSVTTGGLEFKISAIASGFFLVQCGVESTVTSTDLDVYMQYYRLNTDGSSNGFAQIGDQAYVQAAYFGKSDDWPAQLLATADIPIAPPLRRALAGGESITTTDPRGVFYLGSNSQEWSINVNGVQDMGFDFIEDVN